MNDKNDLGLDYGGFVIDGLYIPPIGLYADKDIGKKVWGWPAPEGWEFRMDHDRGKRVWHNPTTGQVYDHLDIIWAYNYNAFLDEMALSEAIKEKYYQLVIWDQDAEHTFYLPDDGGVLAKDLDILEASGCRYALVYPNDLVMLVEVEE